MGFNRQRNDQFSFPEGDGWASPMEDESPCGAGKKVGLAKTSQAGLTVAEQLNNFTEQPDKSPHIITGCLCSYLFVISLAAKANQFKWLGTRKTIT